MGKVLTKNVREFSLSPSHCTFFWHLTSKITIDSKHGNSDEKYKETKQLQGKTKQTKLEAENILTDL